MSSQLPKTYEPREHEDKIYELWEKSGFFAPEAHQPRADNPNYFSIVMPPPNVTGVLHIGHAVMLTLEDIMVRYHRMKGDRTLWLPGTDHAAIATQAVVEKKIYKEQGKRRYDLGRGKFLAEIQKFIENTKNTIHKQIRKMGASCDWSREAYTMDEARSQAVRTVFKKMYDDGLIYRGNRIVHWCARCGSTLSDDEVVYQKTKGKLYWIKYGPFKLATTRPETKLGDTAVAVNPKDGRYKKYIGKKYMIPGVLGEFEVVVVADSAVDPEFGSGVVKVTPAHDFADFDIAQRHNVPIKQVINERGRMMENCGKYAGMKTKECREEILKDMEKMGLLEKTEDYEHNIATCYRCGAVIEPLPKLQWFVDVDKKGKSLKEMAAKAVKSGQIKIIPNRFSKVYFHWMKNLRDWCISRQIWFGHRIPVWYCTCRSGTDADLNAEQTRISVNQRTHQRQSASKGIIVSVNTPKKCPNCGGKDLVQDEDTLDTWFSSALWTFSTLLDKNFEKYKTFEEWFKNSPDLKNFHPTSVMETGYDILFFWVARMVMMTEYILGEVPFEKVYLHGLVRDKDRQKMSKSKGNVIDPLGVLELYGTDALRMALVVGNAPGNDIIISEEKIRGYRNFANKIWNASRFVLISLTQNGKSEFSPFGGSPAGGEAPSSKQILRQRRIRLRRKNSELKIQNLTKEDREYLNELEKITKEVTKDIEGFKFYMAAEKLYHYFWHTFADKAIEAMKPRLQSGLSPERARPAIGGAKQVEWPSANSDSNKDRLSAQYTLYKILTDCLKMLHPFMPYLTEKIWGEILALEGKKHEKENLLMVQNWPRGA